MSCRGLILALLLSTVAAAQTQYASPNTPQSSSQARSENLQQVACPWLTQGTAANALGGDVSATVNVSDAGEGLCRFSRQSTPDFLEILVSKAALPTCPPGSTELRGIGGQAEGCVHSGSHGEVVEMISSRVRDMYFTVMLTSRQQKGAVKSSSVQGDTLEQIAEQVAGSLY